MPRTYVVDAYKCGYGKLATAIARNLVKGDTITVIRCESILFPASKKRIFSLFEMRAGWRTSANPSRGPFSFKEPSKIFQRSVRGMLRHKTSRGFSAFKRLTTIDGFGDYTLDDCFVFKQAQAVNCFPPFRKTTELRELAVRLHWKYDKSLKKWNDKHLLVEDQKRQEEEQLKQTKHQIIQSSPELLHLVDEINTYGGF